MVNGYFEVEDYSSYEEQDDVVDSKPVVEPRATATQAVKMKQISLDQYPQKPEKKVPINATQKSKQKKHVGLASFFTKK